MRAQNSWLVFRKDWREMRRNWQVLVPIIVILMLVAVLLPTVILFLPNLTPANSMSIQGLDAIMKNLPTNILADISVMTSSRRLLIC